MAHYYGLGSNDPTEDSERLVADALRKLSDEWSILHHVSWQAHRSGRQGDGEADFILLNPRQGIIVLEVKGGGISIDKGRWKTADRHGATHDIKNPFEQASASKHALLGWLRNAGMDRFVRVGHAVVFPNLETAPFLGPSASNEIIWTRQDLEGISGAVDRTTKHWALSANLSPADLRRIVGLLAPTVEVKRSMRLDANQTEEELIRLTAEQVEVFSGLRASRGGLILGAAGTGKTVLAIARAQQLARDGFRTLLLCYNELLGLHLGERLSGTQNLSCATYHSLCFREARKAGLAISSNPATSWWENQAPLLLIEACAINTSSYDAIVVDEGQDFAPDWIDSLRCLISSAKDAPLFLFADPHQELWNRNWKSSPVAELIFELRQNLRNSLPIAEKVAQVMESDRPLRGAVGIAPQWRTVSGKDVETEIISILETLIDQGLGSPDITVLCESATLAGRLRERIVGPYSLGKWGGRGIVTETISRFKGLESAAVVLVLEDGSELDNQCLAYVGISRARAVLIVAGSNDQKLFVRWG